ncbi:ABC transporter permease [Ferrimicrobium acidiphilum]|uniref:ABC transporter permease n=2 Tax=Acidimicrobiaceae TaxID=84994 RepID=A0ABV3Y559_9ACTN
MLVTLTPKREESSPSSPPRSQRGHEFWRYGGVVPYLAFMALFLLIPAFSVLIGAFESNDGALTFSNLRIALSGPYLQSFVTSFELSVGSTVIAVVVGFVSALAVAATRGRPRALVQSSSSVLANTGGVPLAFAFIATIGNFGVVTKILSGMGLNIYAHGFSLYSVVGLIIVYQYFLIPVMILVMLGPIQNLRPAWVEAARTLGASKLRFWWSVGLPILSPALLSGTVVLFADAFAAYATAEALTSGTLPLVPIQIGSLISGNVAAGEANLGNALGLGMIVVVALAATVYVLSQRRASRWLR